jgi:hypothetical protein
VIAPTSKGSNPGDSSLFSFPLNGGRLATLMFLRTMLGVHAARLCGRVAGTFLAAHEIGIIRIVGGDSDNGQDMDKDTP